MTRRERLERKAELRRDWAEKRREKAVASFHRASELVAHIPMGQPILIGHHSEKHHRATLERSDNAMRAGCESHAMATHHEHKAEGIERQLDACIFSDDDDAIEQLQAKIDAAEQLQQRMKAANAIIRKEPKYKSTPEKLASLVALGFSETTAARLFGEDFLGRVGFEDYRLKNNNANIRRMKQRIEQIKTMNTRKEKAEESPNGVTIEGGAYVRVTFAEKPLRMVLDALKDAGFRWSGGCWVGARQDLPNSVRDMLGIEHKTGSLKWWALDRTHNGAKCKAIVRCGRIYIWPVGSQLAAVADIDNGRWMANHDFNAAPWTWHRLTEDQLANFQAAARDCYCYKGVDRCDFCTSTRTPDGAPSSHTTFGGVYTND